MNKIITWKDADQNLCTLAAAILDGLSSSLRSGQPSVNPRYAEWPLEGGGHVEAGFAKEEGSNRTFVSGSEKRLDGYWSIMDESDLELDATQPTVQCWWSLQNLVRQRLLQARQEIADNRYLQNRSPRVSKQSSRNPEGRSSAGKNGRVSERG